MTFEEFHPFQDGVIRSVIADAENGQVIGISLGLLFWMARYSKKGRLFKSLRGGCPFRGTFVWEGIPWPFSRS